MPDGSQRLASKGRWLAFFAVAALAAGPAFLGCDTVPVIPREVALSGKIPSQQSLVYGRVLVEGWPKTLLENSNVTVEFQNLTTGETSSCLLDKDGAFFSPVLPGRYAVTRIWSGLQSVEPGKNATPILFAAPPGALVYLGTLFIRLPSPATDARGEIGIRDEFAAATRTLREHYPVVVQGSPPLKGLMVGVPEKNMSGILVDVVLSHRLAALMLLNKNSPYTILTRETARAFGVRPDKQPAGMNLQSYGGAILSPPMRLKSIRIGNFELENVEVVIDVDGYFPIGLLGKSVLSHFKVTVDPKKREAKFER